MNKVIQLQSIEETHAYNDVLVTKTDSTHFTGSVQKIILDENSTESIENSTLSYTLLSNNSVITCIDTLITPWNTTTTSPSKTSNDLTLQTQSIEFITYRIYSLQVAKAARNHEAFIYKYDLKDLVYFNQINYYLILKP